MNSILKVSDATSLALHMMAIIASLPDRLVSVPEIAAKLEASENHLAKVCQRLSKAGFIQTVRGPKGGIKLAKAPKEITIRDIYEVMEGPIPKNLCLLGRETCIGGKCILGGLVERVSKEVNDFFSNTTLADINV